MEVATLPQVFRLYDESVVGNSQWIDFDLPLSDFGLFANTFLDFVIPVIKTQKENPTQFPEACKTCSEGLTDLLKYIENQEKHIKLTNHILEIISSISENQEEKMKEIRNIAISIYRYFEIRLKRAHFDLTLVSDKQNSRETTKPLEKLNNYIKNTLSKFKLDDVEIDPLLLSTDSSNKLISFIRAHTRQYPLCNCEQRACIYAIPCSCPCYCKDCWEEEPSFHDQKVCPKCFKPITEFIEIQ